MKRPSDTQTPATPGYLALAIAFLGNPDRTATTRLRHQPGCPALMGDVCACIATLELNLPQPETHP